MANPFLTDGHEEIETAIMLENAYVTDIGNAVAYTDGSRVFINTEDNLEKILPAYTRGMLKWLLWHERYHVELRHHNRFFKYLDDLSETATAEEFKVSKQEVNIIMDILVHDSLSKMFPELVKTATDNLAQMRNRNSLRYTFKTNTLEDMLEEYRKHKEDEKSDKEEDDGEGEDGKGEKETKDKKSKSRKGGKKSHKGGGEREDTAPKNSVKDEDKESEEEAPKDKKEDDSPISEPKHDETDWSKLDEIDDREFITEEEGETYIDEINAIKRKKFKLGKLSQTINALATTVKQRTYAMPSTIRAGKGVILKGRKPGKTALYLVFDATGSMSAELSMFKEIISKSIPQAMKCPCEWFSGSARVNLSSRNYSKIYQDRSAYDYYKGTFEDIMNVSAAGGYNDDGDRTIDLCFLAEQKGYTPIGVTDGGGNYIDHDETYEQLRSLKKTIFVSQNERWIKEIKTVNPSIQAIYIG